MLLKSIVNILMFSQIFVGWGLNPVLMKTGNIVKRRLDNGNLNPVYEREGIVKEEESAVLFFTGLNSIIPGEIYDSLFLEFANKGLSTYVAGPDMDQTEDLLDDLINEYNNVTVIGHSSGSLNALLACQNNKDIKKIVLLDPVDNSILFSKLDGKPFVLKYIEKVLLLNGRVA